MPNKPKNASDVFNLNGDVFSLNVKVECSLIPVSVMSDEILEKISNAVKKATYEAATKAATKELSKQVGTVYKP